MGIEGWKKKTKKQNKVPYVYLFFWLGLSQTEEPFLGLIRIVLNLYFTHLDSLKFWSCTYKTPEPHSSFSYSNCQIEIKRACRNQSKNMASIHTVGEHLKDLTWHDLMTARYSMNQFIHDTFIYFKHSSGVRDKAVSWNDTGEWNCRDQLLSSFYFF